MEPAFRKGRPAKHERTLDDALTPQSFADSLRNGEPHAQLAYDRLRRILRGLAGHSALRGYHGAALEERTHELAQSYCAHLLANPKALAAHAVKGWGAVRVDVRRFLDRTDPIRHGHEAGPMRRHLRRKLHDVLRTDSRFAQHGNRWFLAAQPPRVATDEALDLDTLRTNLPPLPSVLVTGRDDRCPDIARTDDIGAHLVDIFRSGEAALTLDELRDLCWSCLRPAPVCNRPDDNDGVLRELAGDVTGHQALELDGLAAPFVASLSARSRAVVARSFRAPCRPTVRAVAARLGVSHGTVNNELKSFGALFNAWVERHQLKEAEAAFVLEQILDILATEAFDQDRIDAPAPVGAEP